MLLEEVSVVCKILIAKTSPDLAYSLIFLTVIVVTSQEKAAVCSSTFAFAVVPSDYEKVESVTHAFQVILQLAEKCVREIYGHVPFNLPFSASTNCASALLSRKSLYRPTSSPWGLRSFLKHKGMTSCSFQITESAVTDSKLNYGIGQVTWHDCTQRRSVTQNLKLLVFRLSYFRQNYSFYTTFQDYLRVTWNISVFLFLSKLLCHVSENYFNPNSNAD